MWVRVALAALLVCVLTSDEVAQNQIFGGQVLANGKGEYRRVCDGRIPVTDRQYVASLVVLTQPVGPVVDNNDDGCGHKRECSGWIGKLNFFPELFDLIAAQSDGPSCGNIISWEDGSTDYWLSVLPLARRFFLFREKSFDVKPCVNFRDGAGEETWAVATIFQGYEESDARFAIDPLHTADTEICGNPRPLLIAHFLQLSGENPSGQTREYSSYDGSEDANLLKRGSALLVVILLSALGFKFVSDGIDAGRYGGNRGLVKIAMAVAVMMIAVPLFFFFVLGLGAPYPYG